ncbi:hypothetical protein Vafri_3114 [Volvox africanus]|uniref:Uncharacterized protein n=1 Tax=Volvox africanus TaxID=51714 RepID=A0A8J4ETI6_9CHLO|nr:hypothetical protein Vafri_3114 [Volvox africanus]
MTTLSRMTMPSAFYVAILKLWCSGAYFVGLMLISLYSALLYSYLGVWMVHAITCDEEDSASVPEKAVEETPSPAPSATESDKDEDGAEECIEVQQAIVIPDPKTLTEQLAHISPQPALSNGEDEQSSSPFDTLYQEQQAQQQPIVESSKPLSFDMGDVKREIQRILACKQAQDYHHVFQLEDNDPFNLAHVYRRLKRCLNPWRHFLPLTKEFRETEMVISYLDEAYNYLQKAQLMTYC